MMVSAPDQQRTSSKFCMKETLVHFSYHLSDKKFMLLDIQGTSFRLYDPEIATAELRGVEDEILRWKPYTCSNTKFR